MPRTHAIHCLLATVLVALALTVGDSSAKDRNADDRGDDAKTKASARADSHATTKAPARESVDATSTVRYAARGEVVKGEPLRAGDTTRRAPFESAVTKQPVNYGSLRNTSAATVAVSNRYGQKEDNKASAFTKALADNHTAVSKGLDRATSFNFCGYRGLLIIDKE